MNNKLLISFLLVILIALSAGVVSANEDADDVLSLDDTQDSIAIADNEVLTEEISVDGDNDTAINDAINKSSSGDTVNLGENKEYTINNAITIGKNITFTGKNVTLKADGSKFKDAVLVVAAGGSGSTIKGITFLNTDTGVHKYTGDSAKLSNNVALQVNSNHVLIDNCTFYDWWNTGVYLNGARYSTVQNSFFYGGTATFINNLPDGSKDRGTYHISAMSAVGNVIKNNYFGDSVCDGVSIAGSSSTNAVINNTFENNAYAIYFGGRSTAQTLIENNTFIACGWFESDIYDKTTGESTGKNVSFYDLPVISVQKSSDSFKITNNKFYARSNNVLISALEGSTAHGSPSSIGNITITGNEVEQDDEFVDMSSVVLVEIETKNDQFKPIGDIVVKNNTLNGAKAVTFWSQKWGDAYGNVTIPASTPLATIISVSSVSEGKINAVLKDAEGVAITGATISISADGYSNTTETGENGAFTVENVAGDVKLSYDGLQYVFDASETNVYVPNNVATVVTVNNLALKVEDSGNLEITLKDASNNVLANKTVNIIIDGAINQVTTGANGIATYAIKESVAGSKNAVVYFAGDDVYKSSVAQSSITVTKKSTVLSSSKATLKVKKAKAVKVTLKSEGNVLANKKVTITVNGKTFTGKTNAKGVASIKVKITKKGKFTAKVAFAGDDAYSAAKTISVKYTVKK